MIEIFHEEKGIAILQGNAFEYLDKAKDKSVDHVITDPPYSERTHEGARTGKGDKKLVDFRPFSEQELRNFVDHSVRITRRWIVFTCDVLFSAFLAKDPCLIRMGVWIKPNAAPQFTGDRPAQGFEFVAILHDKGKKRWNGGGYPAVWTVNKIEGQHPTEKPLKLIKTWIEQFTDPGDLILDPFMGAGTTLVAAKQLGRRAVGIEMEEKYCKIAAKRLSQKVILFGEESER